MRHAKGLSSYRIHSPRLETLEDRLPPGDALLGVLWGMGLMAPDVGWPGLSLRSPGTASGMANRGVEDSAPATQLGLMLFTESFDGVARPESSKGVLTAEQVPSPTPVESAAADGRATPVQRTTHQPDALARAGLTSAGVASPSLTPRVNVPFSPSSSVVAPVTIHPAFAAGVSRGGHANGPTASDDVLTPGKESVGKLYRPDPPPGSRANTIYVDDDTCPSTGDGSAGNPYCKIQDGLNAAANGDSILVDDGTYVENLVAPNGIDFTLQSVNGPEVTVIDGSGQSTSVFSFLESGQSTSTVVDGFTLTGGTGYESLGSTYGGRLDLLDVGLTLRNSKITGNSASLFGGGIYVEGFSASHTLRVENCAVFNNSTTGAGSDGGGMLAIGANLIINGVTLSSNMSDDKGDGIFRSGSTSTLTVANSIVYGNGDAGDANEIYIIGCSACTISYTDIEGGQDGVTKASGTLNWGPGILNVDPKFVNPSAGDYHLKPGSPVINKGDPAYTGVGETDIDGDPRVLYGRIDLGADEWVRARPKPADADPVGPPTAVP